MTDTAYLTTTLAAIRQHSPCEDGWAKLLKHLGKTKADNEPLALVTVLDSNGIDDALWCLRAVKDHEREMRLFAVWCARQVQQMKDARSMAALDVAERHANGSATNEELAAARDAARDAARAAAWAAAWDAAWDAAWAAAWAAADAAAARAAWAAAWDAARAAAWDAQALEFRRRFGGAA